MRLNLFLLLVTLICIACDSVVASSRGLVQVKTLDVNSQHERTDGIRRKLREEVVAADVDDGEERAISFPEGFGTGFTEALGKMQESLKTTGQKIRARFSRKKPVNPIFQNQKSTLSIPKNEPVEPKTNHVSGVIKPSEIEETSPKRPSTAKIYYEGAKMIRREVRDTIARPALQNAKNKANNLLKNIENTTKRTAKRAKNHATKTGKAVKSTVNNGVNNFKDAATPVRNQVKDFLRKKPNKSKDSEALKTTTTKTDDAGETAGTNKVTPIKTDDAGETAGTNKVTPIKTDDAGETANNVAT